MTFVQRIMNNRIATPPIRLIRPAEPCLTYQSPPRTKTVIHRLSADDITDMFISMMFAKNNTSSNTASWKPTELMLHRDSYDAVIKGIDVSYEPRTGGKFPCAEKDSVPEELYQRDVAATSHC